MALRSDDYYWLLTWTAFGTWLPGDRRGSTSPIRAGAVTHVRLNVPGEPPAPPQPHLERWVRGQMTEAAVRFTAAQAEALLAQFRDTARYRGWTLVACAVMHNHVHVVIRAGVDTPSTAVLGDLKRYGSRVLNQQYGRRRWWTRSGSRRQLRGEAHVIAAIRYVRNQYRPLAVWIDDGA